MTTALGRYVLESLAPAATRGPYALIDYPNYLNPGDAAIWLGARRALELLNGRQPAYTATLRHFSTEACRNAIGSDGTLYMLGGGNFGDLYPRHQRMRNDVLKAMPHNPVVMLPMSCAWADDPDRALVAESVDILAARRSLIVFARDHQARRELLERCQVEAELSPDLSHVLEFQGQPARQERFYLLRNDRERVSVSDEFAEDSWDWRDFRAQRLMNIIGKVLVSTSLPSNRLALQDWVAWQKVRLAVGELSAGETVVTDRLHAALIASQLRRKVLMLDNSTGKLHAYHDTWQSLLPDVGI